MSEANKIPHITDNFYYLIFIFETEVVLIEINLTEVVI